MKIYSKLFAILLGTTNFIIPQSSQAADVDSVNNMLPAPITVAKGSSLLTIFLKHDQSKPLAKINAELTQQEFFKRFPPKGIRVVSWYVMMGIGQVVTLEVPADRLREVNRAIEDTAWGGFKTEFYPTYDYVPVAKQVHAEALK
ncbi:hypothetical protein [Paraburkholderia tropica]|uniref:hypothetical protein n=1 Tax=Paraburkholderia tropica TaxID=92647 RepID=UPI002AB14C1B|nr:hypothetical protein [Paraburkholderia tropica]